MKPVVAIAVFFLGLCSTPLLAQASFVACTAIPNSKVMHADVGEAAKETEISAAVEFNANLGKKGEVSLENLKGAVLYPAKREETLFDNEALTGRFQISTNRYEFVAIHTVSTDLPGAGHGGASSSSSSSSSLIVADDNDGMSLMLPPESIDKKNKGAFQATLLLDGTLAGGRVVLKCAVGEKSL